MIVEQAPLAIEDLMDEMEEEEEGEVSEGNEEEEDMPSEKLFERPRKGEDGSALSRMCPQPLGQPALVPASGASPRIPALTSYLVSLFLPLPPKSMLGPQPGRPL